MVRLTMLKNNEVKKMIKYKKIEAGIYHALINGKEAYEVWYDYQEKHWVIGTLNLGEDSIAIVPYLRTAKEYIQMEIQ
jgi:hypothetical protein